jgi:hypothetical protein
MARNTFMAQRGVGGIEGAVPAAVEEPPKPTGRN